PAVYAFAGDEKEEQRLIGLLRGASPNAVLLKARPHNQGALRPGFRGAGERAAKGAGAGESRGAGAGNGGSRSVSASGASAGNGRHAAAKSKRPPLPTAARRTGSRPRRRRSLRD